MTAPCIACKTGVTLTGERDADGDLIYPGNEYHTSNPRMKIRGVPYKGALCRECARGYRVGAELTAEHLHPMIIAFQCEVEKLRAQVEELEDAWYEEFSPTLDPALAKVAKEMFDPANFKVCEITIQVIEP